jgi:hypothetical protein
MGFTTPNDIMCMLRRTMIIDNQVICFCMFFFFWSKPSNIVSNHKPTPNRKGFINTSFNVTLSLALKTAAQWHVVLSLSYKVTAARSNCACNVVNPRDLGIFVALSLGPF